MSTSKRSLRIVALPALLLAFGCASTNSSPTPDPVAPEPPAPTAEKKGTGEMETSSATLTPVYFDLDRALLRSDARGSLKRHAKSILDHPEWGTVTIDGHCDERGSEEYNLALGTRRAAVVERYLRDLGVPSSRLATHTFGEEKPAVVGHDEESWRRNRRSEFRSDALASASR